MKKYILLVSVLIAGAFSACDYNDRNFDGLDELEKPTNLASYEYTMVESDISTIVSALRATGNADDAEMANTLNADKMFSASAPASTLIPYLLTSKYTSADVKSTATITYNYKEGRNETVTGLSTQGYQIAAEDYQTVWGDPYVEALTPEKSPEQEIPTILASRFADASEGTYKNVGYYYSTEEPETSIVETKFLDEPFEGYEAGSGVLVDIEGWINKDLIGSLGWQCRSYSGNNYVQVSANNQNVHDSWLITKAIDLTASTGSPVFSFDVTVGYFTANCLTVLISDNFDGNEDNILTASWTDITTNFNIPEAPASGYGTLSPAGDMDLSAYKGKTVYIAFRYDGDNTSTPKKTTTYQIDKVKVSEEVVGIDVEEKSLQYAVYQFNGSKWAQASSDIVILQPEDYASMGKSYLSSSEASDYLPIWLKGKYPYAKDQDAVTVVYKTNATTSYYADECVFDSKSGAWTINSFVTENTDQFVRSTAGWMFDPTIMVDLQDGATGTAEYQIIVDYVIANQAVDNPALVHNNRNAEYYYGFSAYYRNVSYRDKDRSVDPLYPINGDNEEKEVFCNTRTMEGLQLYLTLRYPDAQPTVNGVTQLAEVDVKVYSSHRYNYDNEIWTYTFECTGNKEWKFVERVSENGTIEKAE